MSLSDKIALIALIVAVISLAGSIWAVLEQRRQWRSTSMGRVDLSNVSFVHWRVIPVEEKDKTKWDYAVYLAPLMENNNSTGNLGLMSRIVAVDSATGKAVSKYSALTLHDFEALMQSLGEAGTNFRPTKNFQVSFALENVGGTPVSDCRFGIEYRALETWAETFDGFGTPVDVSPGKSVSKQLNLYAPLSYVFPDKLPFKIRIEYKTIDGEEVKKTVPIYYEPASGAFKVGE